MLRYQAYTLIGKDAVTPAGQKYVRVPPEPARQKNLEPQKEQEAAPPDKGGWLQQALTGTIKAFLPSRTQVRDFSAYAFLAGLALLSIAALLLSPEGQQATRAGGEVAGVAGAVVQRTRERSRKRREKRGEQKRQQEEQKRQQEEQRQQEEEQKQEEQKRQQEEQRRQQESKGGESRQEEQRRQQQREQKEREQRRKQQDVSEKKGGGV